MFTLPDIKAEVDRLAAKLDLTDHQCLPTYGYTKDGAWPHIEVDSRGYHYVVVERGQENLRFTTREFDELLYRVFADVTFSLALDYELAHRVERQDCRRIGFQRQVELLGLLSPKWAQREAEEHARILSEHPFDDYASVRAQLSTKVGWKKACEQ